jgi:starch phosphorylase
VTSHFSIPHEQPEIPLLPERLAGLKELAYNLYWTWNGAAQALFERIDPEHWHNTTNPVRVLRRQTSFDALLEDEDFLREADEVVARFQAYMNGEGGTWYSRYKEENGTRNENPCWTYFCTEYGLHESLPIYSGGLGILAGDHTKTASDMGLPFVGVGLFYSRGYYMQSVDADGQQQHAYPVMENYKLPMSRVLDPETNEPLRVIVDFPDGPLHCGVLLMKVGRVPLLLLNTNIPENRPSQRTITDLLYVSGREMRLIQEIVLGVGGVRALQALNIQPSVWHLNEGHSAFMLVERLAQTLRKGRSWPEAITEVRERSVFTIHTPVPAGNERFDASTVYRIASPTLHKGNLNIDSLFKMAQGIHGDDGMFDMTALCLRLSCVQNGVSKLHGETADETWRHIAGQNVLGITNGVHVPTWGGRSLFSHMQSHLQNKELLSDNQVSHHDWLKPVIGEAIEDLDVNQLWQQHKLQKQNLLNLAVERTIQQLSRHGQAPLLMERISNAINAEALTIGFARRFATYKRANLIFSDPERLRRLLTNPNRPVQLIFAGKAHPADRHGQGIIQNILKYSRAEEFEGRVLFLENYDMAIGRLLVQGVDVWLNNPRRPLEASGTSGMKAAMNGVPNLSILDGWWDEGYAGDNGWAIGAREKYDDVAHQDYEDAQSLYHLLEHEIVPSFYTRNEHGTPEQWVHRMKRSVMESVWRFSTVRMLEEYVEKMYDIC